MKHLTVRNFPAEPRRANTRMFQQIDEALWR